MLAQALFEGLFGGSGHHAGLDSLARLKGVPLDPPAAKVLNSTYGVDPAEISSYTGKTFTCKNGESAVISSDLINDGWCDCEDGSDEPGSSACSDVDGRVFVCTNDGHRPMRIPSGRVDDGICDCCDGSDEGRFSSCGNFCLLDGKAEELAKAGLLEDFKTGSSQRKGLVNEATKLYNEKRGKQREMDEEIARLHEERNALQSAFDAAQKERDDLVSHLQSAAEGVISRALHLEGVNVLLTEEQLDSLVKALLMTLDKQGSTKNDTINDFLREKGLAIPAQAVPEEDEYPDTDEEDDYSEYNADMDMEGDIGVNGDSDTDRENTVQSEVMEEDLPSEEAEVPREHLREFLQWAVRHQHLDCHKQVSVLVGFYLSSPGGDTSVETAADFVKNTDNLDDCSSFFAESPEPLAARFCEDIPNTLKDELASYRDVPEASGKDEVAKVDETIRSKESEVREAKSFQERFLKFQGGLPDGGAVGFLARDAGLEDNCVKTKDHTYEYSVCFGDPSEARQGGTRLGQLDRLEMESETGEMKLYFNEGDHCWNHGPRVAEVSISCGASNYITSISEPSTCVYFVDMQSPHACTPGWKKAKHLLD